MDFRYYVVSCLIGVFMFGVHTSVSQDPCLDGNSLELDHLKKRSSSYEMDSSPLCDRYLPEAWYRVTNYTMPASPPDIGYCGTLYPVWLNDTVPSDGVTKTLTACEVGFLNNCERTYKIEVKKCTSFLVYKLKPLNTCNSAYCFDLSDACINETVSSVKVSFHNITWNSQQHPDQPGIIRHDPYINLLCSFTPSDDDALLYHIDWYVDNDTVIKGQTVDKASLQDAILSAEDLNKAGKKINSWIHCIVGIKMFIDKPPCLSESSNLFFAGFEILNHSLTIKRKGKEAVMVRPTIPFASETLEIANRQIEPSPLHIQLSFPENVCDGNVASCSVAMPSYKHEDRHMYQNPNNWNNVYKFDVYNTDDENYYLSNRKLVLRLETSDANGVGAKIFAGASFNDVHINVVEDQEAWKGKRCSSYADPHQTTFDGQPYECQATGCISGRSYIFYRNEHHLQEIQVRHGSCWGSPRCVCAVAARAGQDVFTIDACNKYPLFNFPICNENSLKVIKEYDKIYKIILPTGTIVKIMLYGAYKFWYINLEVYPTIADFSKTSGLCGFLDNNKNNDFQKRDGSLESINSNPPDAFSLSWQITSGSSEDLLSYSQNVYDNLTPLSSYFHKLCTCVESETKCSYKQYNECKTRNKGKEYHCVLHSTSRKKRDLEHMTQSAKHRRKSSKFKRELRQMYSDNEAFVICNEAFQQSRHYYACLRAVPNFSNDTLVNCISDIIMTGDQNLTQLHLDTALSQCQSYILLNSTLQDENPDVTTLVINLCHNNCSNRGVCSEGKCTCNHGFGGSDCSFDVLSPPTITRLSDNGLCDKSEEACEDITLYGHYFVENMETTCYVTREEVDETDTRITTDSYRTKLEERTLSEGYVRLQFGEENAWITIFHFNMSNDDRQFSELYTVHVYQSECQTFNNNSGDITFTLQNGYCFIDGQCIKEGISKSNDSCLQCRPSSYAFKWTACTTEDTSPLTTAATTSGSRTSPVTTSTLSGASTTLSVDTTTSSATRTPSATTPTSSNISTTDTDTLLIEKPSTENQNFSPTLAGLIAGIVVVSVIIIVMTGYVIKKKYARGKPCQPSSLKEQNETNARSALENDNLFQFSPADGFSRPPSSTSFQDRACPTTNDFRNVFFPPNS